MDTKMVENIRQNWTDKSSDELIQIWKENDHERWSDSAFEAARRILTERGIAIPAQHPPKGVTPQAPPWTKMKTFKVIAVIAIVAGLILLGVSTRKARRKAIESMRAIVNDVCPLIEDCKKMGDNTVSIRGKCLVWDMSEDFPDRANGILPKELKSGLFDREVTVFMVLPVRKVLVGHYSISGQAGYRQYMDVCVAYWPGKKAVGMHSVVSKEPVSSRSVVDIPEYGNPSEPIARWIRSLPKTK